MAAVLGTMVLLQSQKPSIGSHQQGRPSPNNMAPDFTLTRLNGETVRLSDYRGKVVFLNIWATWCPPCREEMPAMESLYAKMKGQAFEILAVSIDKSGAEAVAPFMKQNNLSFPALLDPKGTTQELYRISGVPETFIIDKNGIIVSKIIGPRNWADAASVRYFKELVASSGNGAQ